MEVVDTLLCPSDGVMKVILTNYLRFSQWLEAGRDVKLVSLLKLLVWSQKEKMIVLM